MCPAADIYTDDAPANNTSGAATVGRRSSLQRPMMPPVEASVAAATEHSSSLASATSPANNVDAAVLAGMPPEPTGLADLGNNTTSTGAGKVRGRQSTLFVG